jgi:PAS domain S-box-containing protein
MAPGKEPFKERLSPIKTPGVQSKFLLGIAGILFFFCLFWSATIYFYQKNSLQEEAFRRTELIMAAVNANRSYIQDTLRPKMYEVLGHDNFVLEAMSTSYASRVIMEKFREQMPDITYRRVAINAKNPRFEANPQELEMMQYFNENPDRESWQGIRSIDGDRYYVRYSPVYYDNSCLHCHGSSAKAPVNILQSYGEIRGFNKKTDGRVDSVVSVGIRVEESLRRINKFAAAVFSTVLISFFFLYTIIAFSFNRLIVQNIRALLALFRHNLSDQKGELLYQEARNRDEIGELHATAALLARHLQENRQKLEDYAENLEEKVEERTRALLQSQDQLHQQMQSQGRELKTLNRIAELITQSMDLFNILPRVLRQTLEVIPAKGAGMYLFRSDRQGLFLQCQDNAPELAEQLPCDMVSRQKGAGDDDRKAIPSQLCPTGCEELNFCQTELEDTKLLNIPLFCRHRLLGVITLTEYDSDKIDPKHRELLLSIGRQVGVTLESLQNMASLLQGKELLQSVFDAIADLVVLISPDGHLQMVNKAFLSCYDFSPEMIVGHSTEELAAEHPVPFELFSQISLIKLREPVSDFRRLANGQSFEAHFYPAFDDQGELKNIVCYAKDVTLQKQVEHRMQQAEKLVALGQLAAGVAHEINNPLGIILCYIDLLKDDLSQAPEKIKDLDIIEKHVKSCQRIVQDLLSFSRNQQTTRILGLINSAIDQVVSMVASQLAKQGISLTLDLDPDIPLFAMDTEKMKQVFMNLIMNAAQAMDETEKNKEIRIQSRFLEDQEQVEIIVRDNGPGIAAEIQDKIFEPFFSTKGLREGTGLGLSLSYGIVHDHGGEIFVHSAPGQGTVFTIILPLNGP